MPDPYSLALGLTRVLFAAVFSLVLFRALRRRPFVRSEWVWLAVPPLMILGLAVWFR